MMSIVIFVIITMVMGSTVIIAFSMICLPPTKSIIETTTTNTSVKRLEDQLENVRIALGGDSGADIVKLSKYKSARLDYLESLDD